MMPRFNRIHAMCEALHFAKDDEFKCKGCPAWFRDDEMPGRWRRGCYALAESACNIARYGNPWGAKAAQKHVAAWRKRKTVRKVARDRGINTENRPWLK